MSAIAIRNAQRTPQFVTMFKKVNVGRAVILVKAVAENAKIIRNARMPIGAWLALKFEELKFWGFDEHGGKVPSVNGHL